MHDIYRTDKLSTDMGQNDIDFIAPINKWKPIDSSAFRVQVTAALNCSDSACVALITSSFVNMSSPVWKFFSVAEEDNSCVSIHLFLCAF